MPQTLGFLLFQLGAPLGLVNFVTLGAGAALVNTGISVLASYAASQLLRPQSPSLPQPADGKFNLKQNVPFKARIYGTVKKGGDYTFLAQNEAYAYHVIALAAHECEEITSFWLNDEAVTLTGNTVTTPAHFTLGGRTYVDIYWRTGLATETAYSAVTSVFAEYDSNHRGDGIASMMMVAATPPQDDFQTVFPQNMPVPTALIKGAKIWDPRLD